MTPCIRSWRRRTSAIVARSATGDPIAQPEQLRALVAEERVRTSRTSRDPGVRRVDVVERRHRPAIVQVSRAQARGDRRPGPSGAQRARHRSSGGGAVLAVAFRPRRAPRAWTRLRAQAPLGRGCGCDSRPDAPPRDRDRLRGCGPGPRPRGDRPLRHPPRDRRARLRHAANVRAAAARALDAGCTHYRPAPACPSCARRSPPMHGPQGLPGRPSPGLRDGRRQGGHVLRDPGLADPGDEVIFPDPGFPIYESMTRFVGGTPVPSRSARRTTSGSTSTSSAA